MRRHTPLFRLGAALAIGGFVLAPLGVRAQDAPPAAPPAAAPPADDTATAAPVDPPARVGRIAALTGTVSFRAAGQADWQAAQLNYPIAMGDAVWTQPNAIANLGLGGIKLVLDQQTEADLDTLTDQTLAVTEPQGAIYVHLYTLAAGTTTTVTTPRGAVNLTATGRYEIVAGDATQPTRVEVIDGAANILVGNVALEIAPHQAATVTGSDAASFQGAVGGAVNDAFINAQLARERPQVAAAAPSYTPPPIVQDMTGYDALETVGQWQPTPEYGEVWYPPVQANYVPYRDGHWAFVAPWGWTWVDDAPWGFAPFHYGRWARIHDRWGWVPVEPGVQIEVSARPVYAPALVTFIGFGAGVAVGAALASGHGGGSVGWVPLAPGEPYHPAFHASEGYVRSVNINHVTNITVINSTTVNNHYANAAAATVVPSAAMTESRPVGRFTEHVTPQQLAAARPVAGQAPVRPTAATVGVTPAVAHQMRLEPAGAAAPTRRAAPGPAVTPAAAEAAHGAPGHPALPALARPASVPSTHAVPAGAAAARPAEPRPAEARPGETRPGETRPGETRPGETRPAVEARPAAGARPDERPAAARPAEHPATAPTRPEARPEPRPEARPAAPAARAAEPARPEQHATPPAKPAEHPAAAPRPEARPTAAPKAPERPAPAAAARPAEHPAPAPAARPAEHPAPAARPAPPRPQPQPARAAPPAQHEAPKPAERPAEKPQEKKCPGGQKTC